MSEPAAVMPPPDEPDPPGDAPSEMPPEPPEAFPESVPPQDVSAEPMPESEMASEPGYSETPSEGAVFAVDPATLEAHPYADLLPLMTESELRGLRNAVDADGQQVPAVRFENKLLDGRNRRRVCLDLGIPLLVREFTGTAAEALVYVLSVNQHRRDLSKSQRATIAATLIPHMSEEISQKRIEKLRESYRRRAAGQTLANLPKSIPPGSGPVSARAIAADIMGVADRYVGDAIRLQRDYPELFSQVRAGRKTLNAAITRLTVPPTDAALTDRLRALRARLNALMRRALDDPDLIQRLEKLVDVVE